MAAAVITSSRARHYVPDSLRLLSDVVLALVSCSILFIISRPAVLSFIHTMIQVALAS